MKLKPISGAVFSSFFAMALVGCASAPTHQQMAEADYGSPMTPEQCKSIAHEHISNLMRDPSASQFRADTECEKGWSHKAPLLGLDAAYGYIQSGQANGKNAFGAYVGFRKYQVLMKNGRVIRSCLADSDGLCLMSPR